MDIEAIYKCDRNKKIQAIAFSIQQAKKVRKRRLSLAVANHEV